MRDDNDVFWFTVLAIVIFVLGIVAFAASMSWTA